MNNELRWKQLFQNFEKSFQVFQRRIDEYQGDPEMEAFQMALIQSFEIILELAWKTLKDYLENEGFNVNTPKQAFRQAYQADVIRHGDEWMEALKQRSLAIHTYNEEIAKEVLNFVDAQFYAIVRELYFDLKEEL